MEDTDNGRHMELAQRHVVQEHNQEVDHVIHQLQYIVGRIVHHWENRLIRNLAIQTRAQVIFVTSEFSFVQCIPSE